MQPKISVIIPCYNRKTYVTQAIDSVLNQRYLDHEIIVIDDGSSDNLAEVLLPYNDRIIYLRKDKNEGVSAARNLGLLLASGEYVSFLDSDDVWLPNKSEVQLAALLSDREAGMAVSGCEYIDENDNSILKPTLPDEPISYEDLCIYTAIPGSTSNVLIRKSLLESVGGFDPSLHVSEDRDLWMRIARSSKLCSCKEITARIRIHDEVRKNREFALMFENRRAINRKIEIPVVRRKADAWLYFYAYTVRRGNVILSAYYLLRSFVHYPLRIHKKLSRLRGIAEKVLPPRAYDMFSTLKRLSSGSSSRGDAS